MATSGTNYINTTTGNGLLASVNNTFDQFPFLNQHFNADARQCAIDNMMNDCEAPPSLTQIDADIVKADSILEFIINNEVFDKDTQIFLYTTIIQFLKVKKCIHGQYPCWADKLYQTHLEYLNSFEFVPS